MNDIVKSIESLTNKNFSGKPEELKDLILTMEAQSIFDSENWTSTNEFILKYLKELNLIYNIDTVQKPIKKKMVSILGSMPKLMPKEYGYDYSNKAYKDLRKFIKSKLYEDKISEVWVGLSQGVDWCVAHAVIEMRELGFPIKLCCAVPFKDYECLFKSKNLVLYQNIIRRADIVEVLSTEDYSVELFEKRNEYLVKKSPLIYVISDSKNSDFEKELKLISENKKELKQFDLSNLTK